MQEEHRTKGCIVSFFLPKTQEKSLHHQQDNAAIWVKVETNTNNLVKL